MEIQDLDAVGLQALQARLERAADVAARAALRVDVAAGRVEALGGDHKVVAAAAHAPAENLLRAPLAVLVCGIEKGDAGVAAGLEHRPRGTLVGIAAEGHRPRAPLAK